LKRFNAFDSIHPNRQVRLISLANLRSFAKMIRFVHALSHPFSNGWKVLVLLSLSSAAFGQYRGSSDWSTNGGDGQRTSWIHTDPKISVSSLSGSGFQLVWKMKLGNEPLSAPVLIERYIGYRGFRSYAFVGGSAEDAFAVDSDLGRLEWQKRLLAGAGNGSGNCPGGMTAALTRPVSASFPSTFTARYGGGRGGPARSGVGEPLEGAVTLAEVAESRPPTPPAAAPAGSRPARPAPQRFGPRPTLMYSLSSDGAVHTMYVSNGEEAEPAVHFLPANANVTDFSVVDGVAYATTTNHCGGAADGVWAINLATKDAMKWEGSAIGGEPAFAPAGTYVTDDNKLTSLDPKSLASTASYDAGTSFTTAPVVFEYKTKVMVAAATKDGAVHLVDASAPTVAATKSAAGEAAPYALSTWQTTAETRWIVATGAKSITGWKIVDHNGNLSLQQAWNFKEVTSPTTPLIINGVLFTVDRGDRTHHATLLAVDASTGKQLWSSGNVVSSFVGKSGGIAAGGSAIYFGTHDGTLWDFGFPIEH
jgi:outer membrane protein assembly factor BamB